MFQAKQEQEVEEEEYETKINEERETTGPIHTVSWWALFHELTYGEHHQNKSIYKIDEKSL